MLIALITTLVVLLLLQYILVFVLIINDSDMIQNKGDFAWYIIPYMAAVVFVLVGLYELIFDPVVKEELTKKIKALK